MTQTILSLTTVPPRFPVVHENLRTLLKQNAKIDAINLYIPRKYRRFEYEAKDLPKLPKGISLRIIDEDLGPATKILPAVREYKGQDVVIIFCDDDKVYDNNWAQRLIDASVQKPGCCICEEGSLINTPYYSGDTWASAYSPKPNYRKKDLAYRLRRAVSFGMWKPSKTISSGYVDMLEGWGGVLVRPDFFDDIDYNIPDILWTVDDVWLSGCLERKGIPIWLNADDKVRSKGNSDEVAKAALRNFVYKGHDRGSANRACIDYYRDTYGIWGGTKR
tara:strand:- start:10026 stop:10853 length:828 start_codon:yes stop_codon:yes gene_type:complete